MDVFVERCAGIDIGKADVKACVRVPGTRHNTFHHQTKTFSTMTGGLLALRDWLVDQRVTVVGMESTGHYWKPVYYVLEDTFECWLINPQHIKKVPGRKSDVTDAQWIARLVQYGLVRPSFVPPPPIRQLRDLTRYRASLVHERTRHVQRLHNILEDAGIKLSLVASDIMGMSGRAMLGALIEGERDPEVLADLALGRLRGKNTELVKALVGRFTDHHAWLCALMLTEIDSISAAIAQLDTRIDEQMAPFRHAAELLVTIPGVGKRAAEVIIAEIGNDMTRFASPGALASWAGMCPGNNESAGKRKATPTRAGDPWLRAVLGECATAAARTKHTYISERHRRLSRRRGDKRAKVATGRIILESCWQVLTRDSAYHDLGPEHLNTIRDPNRAATRAIRQLLELGYRFEPAPGKVLTATP